MARLTKEQWAEARVRWESDPRDGFAWLADELGISRPAVSKMASSQGWAKAEVTQVTQPEKVTQKLRNKVTQVTPDKPNLNSKSGSVIQDAEWEEVDEIVEKLHKNSKYDQRFDEQAFKLCLLGAIDDELADFFHVDVSTINRWKISFPNFCASINRGKMVADADAAVSLFKRACGYQYTEVKTKELLTREVDEEGNEVDGEMKAVEVVSTVKEVPPDTGAAFIWLKNRRSQNWRDKQEIEITNRIGPDMLKRLETDMMERMERARQRQLAVLEERGIDAD